MGTVVINMNYKQQIMNIVEDNFPSLDKNEKEIIFDRVVIYYKIWVSKRKHARELIDDIARGIHQLNSTVNARDPPAFYDDVVVAIDYLDSYIEDIRYEFYQPDNFDMFKREMKDIIQKW